MDRRKSKQHYLDSLNLLDRVEVRKGEVQRKEIKCKNGPNHIKFVQKRVDVLLSVDMVKLAWADFVDKIVLVSGDRDFLPSVNASKDAGVIIKLVYAKEPQAYIHTNLLMACDEREILSKKLLDQCLKKKK